ncbi:putative diguanylate cyclase YegE [compost metagenome]
MVRAIAALVFTWAGRTYRIGASVGLTMVAGEPASPLGFMGEADAACYAAKARGRGVAVAFGDL